MRPAAAEAHVPSAPGHVSEAIPGSLFWVNSLARYVAIRRGRAIEPGYLLHQSLSAGCFP